MLYVFNLFIYLFCLLAYSTDQHKLIIFILSNVQTVVTVSYRATFQHKRNLPRSIHSPKRQMLTERDGEEQKKTKNKKTKKNPTKQIVCTSTHPNTQSVVKNHVSGQLVFCLCKKSMWHLVQALRGRAHSHILKMMVFHVILLYFVYCFYLDLNPSRHRCVLDGHAWAFNDGHSLQR